MPGGRKVTAASEMLTKFEKEPADASFLTRAHLEIVVTRACRALLSIPALEQEGASLRSKDLLASEVPAEDGKYSIEQHLAFLTARGEIESGRPLLVLGMRNNLVNPRAIAITRGRAWAAEDEEPERSSRPYFGIGWTNGRFLMETAMGGPGSPADAWQDFFCSGIPVLWDDLSGEELFRLMLAETADPSHLFDLPRGKHPQATEQSRAAWKHLHDTFLLHLHGSLDEVAEALCAAIRSLPEPLSRCSTYLHSILGVDATGNLVNVVGHGRLEDLGRAAARLGCRRAICVENSGSVMPTFYPEGARGPATPLLRAPNFRPKGRAVLAVELADPTFQALPA